jgi:hypothetical protein
MSALGHQQPSAPCETWSALPLKADLNALAAQARLVPKTDSCTATKDVELLARGLFRSESEG